MERRNFILAAGGLIGATTVARAAALAVAPATPSTLGMAGYRALVGQQFIAYQGMRGTALELVAIHPGRAAPHQEQFALVFSGTPGLQGGIYEIDNAMTGRLSIYMEPAGTAAQGALYRAEFSLLV